MSRLTIDDIFDQWRTNMASADYTNTQPAGDAFERLCIAFLNHDPEQKLQFRNTRMYSEWAKGHGMDAGTTGIDLVAELNDGTGFAAIQCKFHAEGATIAKKEIDSFLADSGTKNFKRRVIIDTTGKSWSSNVEKTLRSQVIKVTRLGLHNLRNSPIDWSSYIEGEKVVVQGPPELRPLSLHRPTVESTVLNLSITRPT